MDEGSDANGQRSAYEYQPLDLREQDIRILTIHPGEFTSRIQCSIRNTSLKNNLTYKALSYVWGNSTKGYTVTLDGVAVNVTDNLFSALRRLRHKKRRVVLWVDALCIDQRNNVEKASQVQKMFHIYQSASEVIAWLGESHAGSKRAVEFIAPLARFIEQFTEGQVPQIEVDTRYEQLGFTDKDWMSFCGLWDQPYWTRIWVVQELVSRATSISLKTDAKPCFLQCGKDRASFRDLWIILTYCVTFADYFQRFGNTDVHFDGLAWKYIFEFEKSTGKLPTGLGMWKVLSDRDQFAGADPITLQRMVTITRALDATKDHDKIYSLLALVPSSDQFTEPDYGISFRALLAKYVKFYVDRDHVLDAMFSNRFKPCTEDVPSWTPELRHAFHAPDAWDDLQEGLPFFASGSKPAEVEFLTDDRGEPAMLRAKGIYIGTINHFNGPNTMDDLDLKTGPPRLIFHREVRKFGRRFLSNDDEWDVFWRTLVLDTEQTSRVAQISHPASETLRRACLQMFCDEDFWSSESQGEGEHEQDPFIPTSTLESATMRQAKNLQGNTSSSEHRKGVHYWNENVIRTTLNRTFFATKEGNLGVGPYDTQLGDIVVILYGSRRCIVLRARQAGGYLVVGTAYVHGIMKGEMIGAHGVQETIFDLY